MPGFPSRLAGATGPHPKAYFGSFTLPPPLPPVLPAHPFHHLKTPLTPAPFLKVQSSFITNVVLKRHILKRYFKSTMNLFGEKKWISVPLTLNIQNFSFLQRRMDWWGGSRGKTLGTYLWGFEFEPQHPHKELLHGGNVCDPSTRKEETGASLELPGHKV